ncbi:hypothetical protein H0H81_002512 [Sphagnurus paluster]|uniref:Uncharacterized protein n=1 Tax=Sphagnurus paluster TaxID=117069 RepID=A0A9P7KLS8_9AGAR|nr:hypothetical protein H0H81_002512 [Sphagnurus paluster]
MSVILAISNPPRLKSAHGSSSTSTSTSGSTRQKKPRTVPFAVSLATHNLAALNGAPAHEQVKERVRAKAPSPAGSALSLGLGVLVTEPEPLFGRVSQSTTDLRSSVSSSAKSVWFTPSRSRSRGGLKKLFSFGSKSSSGSKSNMGNLNNSPSAAPSKAKRVSFLPPVPPVPPLPTSRVSRLRSSSLFPSHPGASFSSDDAYSTQPTRRHTRVRVSSSPSSSPPSTLWFPRLTRALPTPLSVDDAEIEEDEANTEEDDADVEEDDADADPGELDLGFKHVEEARESELAWAPAPQLQPLSPSVAMVWRAAWGPEVVEESDSDVDPGNVRPERRRGFDGGGGGKKVLCKAGWEVMLSR